MKIEFTQPETPAKQEIKRGDLLKFNDGSIGVVSNYDGGILVLAGINNSDYYVYDNEGGWFEDFKYGNYALLAKAGDWKIVVEKRA